MEEKIMNHHEDTCGYGHDHEHHHDEHCDCGHDHDHEHHHHDEHCDCGHDHHDHDHHEHIEESHNTLPVGAKKSIYIVENLGCANCAAKMERQIGDLPEVEGAVLTFATKQLAVVTEHPEELLPKIQQICTSIEPEVNVSLRENRKAIKKEKKSFFEENKMDILTIGGGALLFIVGEVLEHMGINVWASSICYIIAYLILGLEILGKAAKSIAQGHAFDENFLMSVATIAAFAIGDFAEAVGVMLFYRVGEFFEDVAVERSRSQIMEAVDMRPETVHIIHGEEIAEIPAEDAVVGDIIVIRPGDRIPLDGIVEEGESRIDTSPVTGEPVPVHVEAGSEVLSGCVNEQGVWKLRVTKPLSESMVTRILDSVENAAANKPKLDRFITRFARVYTPIVVLIAILTAIIPSLLTGDWNHWIYTAITFLVISCPCALVLSIPLAFFSGIGRGSKLGILFKGGASIEALKEVKAIVMDKTGTITKGSFELQKVVTFNKLTEKQILTMAADCELDSTHPIGNSIVKAAKAKGLMLTRAQSLEEISGKGIKAIFPEGEVLCGNRALMEAYGVELKDYDLGIYGTEVLLAVDGSLEGALVIADEVKADAKKSVARMNGLGLHTVMLTGDEQNSAQHIANEVGIKEVHAHLLPEDKLDILKDIRAKHGEVMFVGDGINDAPVLAGADVGAAMGSGADAAIEAADVVFMNSSVDSIPQALSIAKLTGRIAMQNLVFALLIKFLVMILGFAGYANMWMAVFADTGVAMLCVLNSIRILWKK